MPLPKSFAADGFTRSPENRGLLIGTEGGANSGKTEFAWTAPGPAIHLAVDRGHRATLENAKPPASRMLVEGDNLVIIPIDCPMNTGVLQVDAQRMWTDFYQNRYLKALRNLDARTVILDGDSDTFEWQFLAEFGRTNNIPQLSRAPLNAARRVMIARAWNSGKVVITTNKVKRRYETQYSPDGKPVIDAQGKEVRVWDGISYERQGFNDFEYCYELQIKHLYKPAATVQVMNKWKAVPQQWGIRVLMCKVDRSLEGTELWGDDCNLPTLLELAYPNRDLSFWGY